jgi:predicted SnoaL-like aldol condensation-catalyzing enzyme
VDEGDQIMAANNIEKVLTVFKGVGAKDADLATKHLHPGKYIEHNPPARDGVAGFREYIRQSPRENHHLKVTRVYEDRPYVLTQAEGLMAGQGHFFDVFGFESGLIVEHWGFSEKAAPPNQSGHTQTDGPSKPGPSEDTERNKSMMRDYYETVHISGDHSKIPQYFSGDHCIRHEPGVRDAVAAFIHDVDAAMQHRTIDEIKLVLGQGDFVFIAAKGTLDPCAYIDLYRIEDGKIAEHWGFPQKIPPQEEQKSNNGML